MGPERHTELPDGVYGYLLPQLQAFFSQSVKSCVINEKSTLLKPGVSCLLQRGVQPGEIKRTKMQQNHLAKMGSELFGLAALPPEALPLAALFS